MFEFYLWVFLDRLNIELPKKEIYWHWQKEKTNFFLR